MTLLKGGERDKELIITHRLLVVAVEEVRERGWAPASQRWSGGGGNDWRWVRRRRLAGDPATVEEHSKAVEASKGTRVTGLGKAEMRESRETEAECGAAVQKTEQYSIKS